MIASSLEILLPPFVTLRQRAAIRTRMNGHATVSDVIGVLASDLRSARASRRQFVAHGQQFSPHGVVETFEVLQHGALNPDLLADASSCC